MKKEYASFWERFFAFLIDIVILVLLSAPFYFLLNTPEITFNQATLLPRVVLAAIYETFLTIQGRQTIGKRIMNIKVIKSNGKSLTLSESFLRVFIGKQILGTFIIGYLWMIVDKRNQCWQDKLVDSIVVKA